MQKKYFNNKPSKLPVSYTKQITSNMLVQYYGNILWLMHITYEACDLEVEHLSIEDVCQEL